MSLLLDGSASSVVHMLIDKVLFEKNKSDIRAVDVTKCLGTSRIIDRIGPPLVSTQKYAYFLV